MNKIYFLLMLMLCHFAVALSQEQYTLEELMQSAQENHSLSKNYQNLKSLSDEKKANLKVNYLPSLDLDARATYQSDVINIDLNVPGVDFPNPTKDQYKVSLELSQTLYDGGMTRKLVEAEEEELAFSLKELETKIFKEKEKVIDLYFNYLMLNEKRKTLTIIHDRLNENFKLIEAGIENGVMLPSDLDLMKLEMLKLEQSVRDVETMMESVLDILAQKTGRELINDPENFSVPVFNEPADSGIFRTEIQMFSHKKTILAKYADVQDSRRMPKLYAFGQLGYGKPGLNMLSDQFDTYYYAGAGLRWNIWDWKKSSREKTMLSIQADMVDNQEKEFTANINVVLNNLAAEIIKHKENASNYADMLELRKNVSQTYDIQLKKGTIKAIDYLKVVDDEKTTEIQKNTEDLLYQKSIALYKFYQGTL